MSASDSSQRFGICSDEYLLLDDEDWEADIEGSAQRSRKRSANIDEFSKRFSRSADSKEAIINKYKAIPMPGARLPVQMIRQRPRKWA